LVGQDNGGEDAIFGAIDSRAEYDALMQNVTLVLTDQFPRLLQSVFNTTRASISDQKNRDWTLYIALMVVFVLFLIYSYAIYLCVVPTRMMNKVLMTIRLLSIIPPRIIADVPSIRNWLNNSSI